MTTGKSPSSVEPYDAEDLEGLDEYPGAGWGEYPLDAVFVRTEQRTVGEVVSRIEKGRYILDPDFQRDFVWSNHKQSKLIESCIMRIPLPVFYVAEAPDGRIIVVDGLQRLTTFARFLSGELRLTGLGGASSAGFHQLEGQTFHSLPVNLQERVLDTQLTMYILDAKAPERARLDIFERVNSGEVLTRQQMRNALYNGPATLWLKAAAEGTAFQTATAGSLDKKTMRDREAINRFVAFFLLGWQQYSGDMDDHLAKGLRELAGLPSESRSSLRDQFDQAMVRSYDLFKQHAFRKSLVAEYPGASRSVINISLFEVSSVAIARASHSVSDSKIKNAISHILHNEDFLRSITYSTNSTQAVRQRFEMFFWALEV